MGYLEQQYLRIAWIKTLLQPTHEVFRVLSGKIGIFTRHLHSRRAQLSDDDDDYGDDGDSDDVPPCYVPSVDHD